MGWRPAIVAAGIVLIPMGAWGQYELDYQVTAVHSTLFDRSGPNPLLWDVNGPDGLAWDGSGIWVSACDTMTLLKVDPATGEQVDVFYLPEMADMTDHLAWDGQYLWGNVHSMPGDPRPWEGRLVQIDVGTHQIVRSIEVPFRDADSMTPMGMGFDGRYLWTQDPRYGEIYRIDPDTEEGADEPFLAGLMFAGQPVHPCGVSWDGYSCLWISDLSRGVYFQVTADTGEVVSYLVPPDNPDPTRYGRLRPPGVTKLFTGMTTDGRRVWIVDELEGNPLLYEIEVDFPNRGPCAHPVADGEVCLPDGQPFCLATSTCYAGHCLPRCDVPGQECGAGLVCGNADGFAVCAEPIAEGVACRPGGNLPCAEGLFCSANAPAGPRCVPSCGDDDECQDGFVCGGPGGEPVCAPGVPLDEACVPGEAPACDRGLVCWSADEGGARCRPACDRDADCSQEEVCGTGSDDGVCVAAPPDGAGGTGCGCGVGPASPSRVAMRHLLAIVAALGLGLGRRRRRSSRVG